MPIYQKGPDNQSKVLIPTGGNAIIDVVNDYSWTQSNNRAETPVATLTEYQINSGQLLAGIYYYMKQGGDLIANTSTGIINGDSRAFGGQAVENPYQFMYFAKETGFTYAFPWLGSEKFSRSNTFSKDSADTGLKKMGQEALSYGKSSSGLNSAFKGIRGLSEAAAFVGVGSKIASLIASKAVVGNVSRNKAQSWESSSEQSYTISFELMNTFKDTNEIRKNRELAYLLTHQNSPFRRNVAIIDPVCIYSLYIPDVAYFPACYVNNLNITNLGNTRLLDLDGVSRTIPEAYGFNLTFTSLIECSRNVLEGVENESDRNKIKAISDGDAWSMIKSEASNQATRAITAAEQLDVGNFVDRLKLNGNYGVRQIKPPNQLNPSVFNPNP